MTKTKSATSATKKTAAKKVKTVVVEPVIELVEEVREELSEPVETFTVRKSWLAVGAIVLTVVLLAVIL